MLVKSYVFTPPQSNQKLDFKSNKNLIYIPTSTTTYNIEPIDKILCYVYLNTDVPFFLKDKDVPFGTLKFKAFFDIEIYANSDQSYLPFFDQKISKFFADIKEYLVNDILKDISISQDAVILPADRIFLSEQLFAEILKKMGH